MWGTQGSGLWYGKSNGSGADRVYGGAADARPGSPKILSFTYNAGTWKLYANGVLVGSKTNYTSLGASNTNLLLCGSSSYGNSFGEVLIYKDCLSDTNRELAESYLGLKWGLAGNLPTDHNGISDKLPGWSLGAAGAQTISNNLDQAGNLKINSISASPASDNQWHHIVSLLMVQPARSM